MKTSKNEYQSEVVYTMTWACISRLSKNSSKNLNLNFTLMYTDLQIDCIRAFGDKELKFGCVYKLHWEYRKMSWVEIFDWRIRSIDKLD